ncbi:MAG: ABC transporter ATP-binding protein [Armatimonadetes bacterium]|nr:ABC transporter ATP-binding protein [Armatimonadota bacterium]
MEHQILLDIQNIACRYNAHPVLEGVSFEVGQGECLGVCGPNGSGKSTLLRVLSRALAPYRGTVLLDRAELLKMNPKTLAQRMAFVPQDTRVEFDFTAWEIVLMGRSPHLGRLQPEGIRDCEIARQAMEQTGTLHLKDRSIQALSGGERQRVLIARALAQQPEVILLDEPTAHLDISFQIEILGLLRRLVRERGITALIVFHDLNLAAQFCDRILLLKEGRIFTLGDAESVLSAEHIRSVYGSRVWIRRNPVTGKPYFIPIHDRAAPAPSGAVRVHVLCGGGSGNTLLGYLRQTGCAVTVGALNVGDTDQETAEMLDIPYVEEAPFSPISDRAYQESLQSMREADVVVVAAMPFGYGNIRQLEIAGEALAEGRQLFLLDGLPIEDRDFCQGQAAREWESLVRAGAEVVKLEELEEKVRRK